MKKSAFDKNSFTLFLFCKIKKLQKHAFIIYDQNSVYASNKLTSEFTLKIDNIFELQVDVFISEKSKAKL